MRIRNIYQWGTNLRKFCQYYGKDLSDEIIDLVAQETDEYIHRIHFAEDKVTKGLAFALRFRPYTSTIRTK